MSERSKPRRPATFRLDDPGVVVIDADDTARPARGTVQITPEAEPALLPVPVEAPILKPRGLRWGARVLDRRRRTGAARARAQRRQFDRGFVRAQREPGHARDWRSPSPPRWRLVVVSAREAFGLMRLAAIEKLHARAAGVLASDDRKESRAIVRGSAEDRAPESATAPVRAPRCKTTPATSSTAPT